MSKPAETILQGAREAAAYAKGKRQGFVAHIVREIDVAAIRNRLGLSQAGFAEQFGLELSSIRNWEQGRRQPDVSARALLMVIDREPEAVRRALSKPDKVKASGKANYPSTRKEPARPNVST